MTTTISTTATDGHSVFYCQTCSTPKPDEYGLLRIDVGAFARAIAAHATVVEQAVMAPMQKQIAAECLDTLLGRVEWKEKSFAARSGFGD